MICATENRPDLRDAVVAMIFCAIACQRDPYVDILRLESRAMLDWLTTQGIDSALIASGRLYYGAAHSDLSMVCSVLEEFTLPLSRCEQALRLAVAASHQDVVKTLLMHIHSRGHLGVDVLRSRVAYCFRLKVMEDVQMFELLLEFTPIDAAVDLFCANLRRASLPVLRFALPRFAGSENRLISTERLSKWLSGTVNTLNSLHTTSKRRLALLETITLFLSHGASEHVFPQDTLAEARGHCASRESLS